MYTNAVAYTINNDMNELNTNYEIRSSTYGTTPTIVAIILL